MPKITATVLKVGKADGKPAILCKIIGNPPKVGQVISVKWGAIRSLSQNSLYWVFLTWLINEGGLKDQGHYSVEALHLDFKACLLSEKRVKKGIFKIIEMGTTTQLDKIQFGEYLDAVNKLVGEIFHVDTSPFWDTYAQEYQLG